MKKILTLSLAFAMMLSVLLVSAFYIGSSNMTVMAATNTQGKVLKPNMLKLDDPDIMTGVIVSRTGEMKVMSDIWTGGYIAVTQNTWYTYNTANVFIPCFDINKQFIGFADYVPNEEQRTDITQDNLINEGCTQVFIHPSSAVAFVRPYFEVSNTSPIFVLGKGLLDDACKIEIAFLKEGNPDLFFETLSLIQDNKHFDIDTRNFAEGCFTFNTRTLVYSLTDDTQMVFAVDMPITFLKSAGYFNHIDNLTGDKWYSGQFNAAFNTPSGIENWGSDTSAKFRYRQAGTSTIEETPEPTNNDTSKDIPIWQIVLGAVGGLLVLSIALGAVNSLINPSRRK